MPYKSELIVYKCSLEIYNNYETPTERREWERESGMKGARGWAGGFESKKKKNPGDKL